jgi:PAS domain S-box-containing protein
MPDRRLAFLGSLHFWVILALFAVCCILHYPGQLVPLTGRQVTSLLGLERHALDRILFLAPITYAAFIFGLRGGVAYLLTALLAMLPRALLISPAPTDALFETGMTVCMGVLILGWLETRRREIGKREQTILKLESVKKQLEFHVRTAQENEQRIRALHAISRTINQSFSLQEVVSAAANPIRELLHAESILIYLAGDSGALVLQAHSGLAAELATRPNVLRLPQAAGRQLPKNSPLLLAAAAHRRARPFAALMRLVPQAPLAVIRFQAQDRLTGLLCAFLPTAAPVTEQERLLSLLGMELSVAAERAYYLRELERISMHFREVFEKAHDAIWLQDGGGNIISANQAASRLSGYTRAELLALNAARLFDPAQESPARAVEKKLVAGEPMRQPYEQRMVRKNGTYALLMQTTSLLGDPQAPVFLHIARDISDARRLQESLRLYAGQISRAHEDERLRVARELHDDTIQTLVSIHSRLDRLLAGSPRLEEQARMQLEEIHTAINDCMIRIRRFAQDLRPPTLDYLGLFPTLRELAGQALETSGLELDLRGKPPRQPLSAEDELLVYRIVQEAVRNIGKHAGCRQAGILIEETKEGLVVVVEDGGSGFVVDADAELVEKGKLGLMGMKERAYLLGGDLKITSAPGKGTRVRLTVPHSRT